MVVQANSESNRMAEARPQTRMLESNAARKRLLDRTSSDTRGVIVIGNDFQAVGVMRALDEAGIPVFLVANEFGIASYSKYAKRSSRNFGIHDSESGVSYLQALAEREGLVGWAIFCVADDTVEFLAKNHEQLSETFLLPVPAWETSQKFYEKDQAYRLAAQCGLAVPKSYPANDLGALLVQDLEFPLVLKPTFKKNYYEKTHDKAVLVRDKAALVREYNEMTRLIPSSQIVVQEFLGGGTQSLFSYAALFDGQQMVSGMAVARLRQHPMDFGHATTYAEARDIPEIAELASRFLSSLGYCGVAEVEFMKDPMTGEYKFIEMNGRFFGWHSLTHSAGLNLPRDLFFVLQERPVAKREPNLQTRWVRTLTDAPTVAREVLRGRMSPWPYLIGIFRKRGRAVWSWRDPLPFLVEVMMAPYLWWKKGF